MTEAGRRGSARGRRRPLPRRAGRLVAALLLAAGAPLAAAGECWRIDPARSDVHFHLVALGALHLHGRFERLAGQAWQREPGGPVEVHVEVEADSLTMASARYQSWARSPEFFDVLRHPRVLFRSAPLPLSLFENGGELQGWLTVRGIERPVAFLLHDPGCSDPDAPCVLHVEGEIRRAEFGMRSRRLTLSDRVALDQYLTVVPDPGGCPAPADPPAATAPGP